MGTSYVLPRQVSSDKTNPSDPDPYGIYGYAGFGGFSPYSGGVQNSSQNFGTALGQAGQMVNPNASMEDIFAANRNQISSTGNLIGQQAGSQLNYYGPLQQRYTEAQNVALNRLNETPGFTPDEASKIGVDYSQFNTSPEQYDKLRQTVEQGVQAQGDMLNAYQGNLGAQLGQYGENLGGALGQYGENLRGATGNYGAGVEGSLNEGRANINNAVTDYGFRMDDAQRGFDKLDAAVEDPSLGFDPTGSMKQMTDADVDAIKTAAGRSVGNQFRTAEDTLNRQAAVAGNTSPVALAAMRERLAIEGGARAGDATADAEIKARQAQFDRAAGIEDARGDSAARRAGMRATAATTEQSAAQRAASELGQAGLESQRYISAQDLAGREAIGRAGMDSARTLGQAGMDTADRLGQANLDATNRYGQFSTGVAKDLASQRYGAGMDEAGMRYSQGMGSARATSEGAQTVGGARQAGESAYRSGVAQQQGMAQQGGQAAQQVQLGAYGTQTQGVTGNATGQAGFETNKASFGDTLAKGASHALFGNAEGGMIAEPTTRVVGENGPELIMPLSRYKSSRYRDDEPKEFGRAA